MTFSSVKALVVSSKTEDGSVVFQGKSELATHLAPDGSGKKVSKFGVYGLDEREPVTDESLVPVPFRRRRPATTPPPGRKNEAVIRDPDLEECAGFRILVLEILIFGPYV